MNKNALVNLTDENTLIGTYVMVESFLRNNAWFNGDIVLITEHCIDVKKLEPFYNLYKNTKVIVPDCKKYLNAKKHFYTNVSNEIKKFFGVENPNEILGGVWPHMLKFEAFGFEEYDRVVFYDSDILIVGDIKDAFFNDYDFVICDDRTERPPYNKNDKRIYEPLFNLNLGIRMNDNITYLNSGFFSIKSPKKEYVQELLEIAENYTITGVFFWGRCVDQDVINIFLWNKNVALFGMEYNSIQFHYNDFYNRIITSEKAIHYIIVKPWLNFNKDLLPENEPLRLFFNEYIRSMWLGELKYVDKDAVKLFGYEDLLN